jgi:hypothetical protein
MSERNDDVGALAKISYGDKTLEEWETELTRKLPPWPCNSSDMISAIIELNTKYQNACNCYNDLLLQFTQDQKDFIKKKNVKLSEKIEEYKASGVKSPAKDTVEMLVVSEDTELLRLKDNNIMIEVVKTFFENNKQKLEKTMMLGKDLLYSISATERATNRVDTHTNGH